MDVLVPKIKKIEGVITASGSKNAALPIIYSTILIKGKTILKRVPNIEDILVSIEILKEIGLNIKFEKNKLEIINEGNIINKAIENGKKLRGSIYLLGSLFHQFDTYRVYKPGGCKIGDRKLDLHKMGFEILGASFEETDQLIVISKIDKTPKKTDLKFDKVSVGATVNMILANVISNNEICIKNPSLEPEVLDLIKFLNKAGAKISYNKCIHIQGVKELKPIEYEIMFDRIEAGSYLLLAASYPNSNLLIRDINHIYLEEVIKVLRLMGHELHICNNSIQIKSNITKPVNVLIDVYPAFPTDLGQILCASLVSCNGSKIQDIIFPNRINHIEEFRKLNINIKKNSDIIEINKNKLINNNLNGIDLRGTFALFIVAGMVEDVTRINGIDNIFRGYEDIFTKLRTINFDIQKL